MTINTFGSSFDTVLAVYTGTIVDALTEVASNNDAPHVIGPSRVDFYAIAETEYRIAVDGYGWRGNTGAITLNWMSSQPINELVAFAPDPSTYLFTPNASGCPTGVVGKFRFDAVLANTSSQGLSMISIEASKLTGNNLLLTKHRPISVGEYFEVMRSGDYADAVLSPGEAVVVPFTVCLRTTKPFGFFVDVLGITE